MLELVLKIYFVILPDKNQHKIKRTAWTCSVWLADQTFPHQGKRWCFSKVRDQTPWPRDDANFHFLQSLQIYVLCFCQCKHEKNIVIRLEENEKKKNCWRKSAVELQKRFFIWADPSISKCPVFLPILFPWRHIWGPVSQTRDQPRIWGPDFNLPVNS